MTALDRKATMVEQARRIAGLAHAGQYDKVGHPYVSHCERVACRVTSQEAKIVAYLHDTLEKGKGWSISDLRDEGLSEDILAAVEALSRLPDETEQQFLTRNARDPLAATVKMADLQDNILQARMAGLDPDKYINELRIFREITGRPRS